MTAHAPQMTFTNVVWCVVGSGNPMYQNDTSHTNNPYPAMITRGNTRYASMTSASSR